LRRFASALGRWGTVGDRGLWLACELAGAPRITLRWIRRLAAAGHRNPLPQATRAR
jgi:hypothetical protein